ncbi:ABC transporter ATP-binding protein [Cupriavidus basilensis]|uniref:ABC transporter ATP-binding protein n=1 Tax=Cupriavidus TaxID=106589 RepID=UPI00044A5155|nr:MULTISPECIES: ABC transporter ATP-binding protein [Cupriavidus]KDP84566.1 branched-chain amino acid ABC transporter substrate-binding protein [Cupriavidus sp. SK-3]MDF3884437.1 ABC transporter ATP-binding protein [Cupriavidus basilensis]
MNTQAILSLRGLRKSFGDVDIIRGVDLDLVSGERHALIGPNGAGKSTLFHLISGRLPLTKGEIVLNGEPIQGLTPQQINHRGLARSFQITNIFAGLTVFENLRLAVMRRHGLQYTLWKFAHKVRAVRDETQHLLEQVRLAERAQAIAGELSYSEQRSLEIAMTLASDPKVIMLDEPMAGMSQEETDYTAGLIREIAHGRTLMIVEHDMDVVFSLSDRISVLVYGEIVATGTPDEIRNNARVKEAYLGEEVTV